MRGLKGTWAALPHLRADDREVLALGPVIAALVAARAADLAHVEAVLVSRIARRDARHDGQRLGSEANPFSA